MGIPWKDWVFCVFGILEYKNTNSIDPKGLKK